MQLPHSETRKKYIEQIKIVEANLKDATSGDIDHALLSQVQKRLDALAEKYQYNEDIGTARYKLYELQAMVHYFKGHDDDALDFINQAIETRGDNYTRAEKLKTQITKSHHEEKRHPVRTNSEPPLQLQALTRGQRSSAIIMAILSILSIYFIPWAIFYIYLAVKLDPRKVPSRKLIKTAAIATLPLCLGIIPIIIDIEFWRANKKLKEYEELGSKAFISDKEYLSGEPRRKKGRVIAWSILLSIIVVLVILVIAAIATSSSSSQSSSTESLAESAVRQLKSESTYPQKIDDITTLTDVTSSGNSIQYHYQIMGADTSNLSNASLYNNVQPSVCSNTDTRKVLDAGITMEYLYEVYETGQNYNISIQESDC